MYVAILKFTSLVFAHIKIAPGKNKNQYLVVRHWNLATVKEDHLAGKVVLHATCKSAEPFQRLDTSRLFLFMSLACFTS